MERTPPPPFELFYCYAHKDHTLRNELHNHLADLRRSDLIRDWHDGEILPGAESKEEIKKHLDTADIILLLISADFMASDTCYGEEMKQAIERHKQGKTRVIPILLCPCRYARAPFSTLKMLPSNGKPVTKWSNRDEAYENIAQDIDRVVKYLPPSDSSPTETLPQTVPFVKETTPTKTSPGENSPKPPAVSPPTTPIEAPSTRSNSVEEGPKGNPGGSPAKPGVPSNSHQLNGFAITPSPPPQVNLSWLKLWHLLVFLAVMTVPVLSLLFFRELALPTGPGATSRPTPISISTTKTGENVGISVSTTKAGERVGISDGRFAFDTNRLDGPQKSEAAQKFTSGDIQGAIQFWQKAVQEDPSDAEALIYLEDQQVLDSHQPYITLVVATILTGENGAVGHYDLQGAYVAQREFNSSHHPFQARLLIANSGSGDESIAGDVAQHIGQAASQDKSIVGVMGWPFSESTRNAVKVLDHYHIPLVAQTASSDALTNISKYFFRIIPPDFKQGAANADYVTKTLHAHRVALFVDPGNVYSKSFAQDFKQPYLSLEKDNQIVATEQYTVGSAGHGNLSSLLQDAFRSDPDVIYFSGYASDLNALLNALPPAGLGTQIPIVGGGGFYELGNYDPSARVHLGQLRFLSYAYPDEWQIAGLASQSPRFFQEYSGDFNPSGNPQSGVYGLTRADNDVIVSYDATITLLTAATSAVGNKEIKNVDITPDQLQQALAQIDDAHPLQGVSGRIAFEADGNPIDKPLLLLSFDTQIHIHEEKLFRGCLQIDHCN